MASKIIGKALGKDKPRKEDVEAAKAAEEAKAKDKEGMDLIVSWASKGETKSFPPKLKDYLQSHDLVIFGSPKSVVGLLESYALFLDDGRKLRVAPPNTFGPNLHPDRTFQALVVPMIEGPDKKAAIKIFSKGEFVRLDLATSGGRVIVTSMLSGCSFVVGFSKDEKNVLYLGHAKPTVSEVESTGAALAKHFREANGKSVFEGVELKDKKVWGKGSGEDGYGDGNNAKAAVMGWVCDSKLFLVIKSDEKPLVVREYENKI